MNKRKNNEFIKNYDNSIKNYKKIFQSNHWKYNNKKKIELFNYNNLKNFRSNGLSYGLDDNYSKKKTLKLFTYLLKNYKNKLIFSLLSKKNIGLPYNVVKKKNFFFTGNELVHIKHLLDFNDKISLSRKSIVCEIGPGYGSLISKIIQLYHSKVILIDLPEANLLSHYYLKKTFPKKKFFLSSDIKNKLSKKEIINHDIIILCPWDELPEIKIDFFINSRSMMEMQYTTINHYFNLIKKNLRNNGYFLCINRYYKDTVGYPIELIKYPFGLNWRVLISKKSWLQNHIHYLLLKKTHKTNKFLIIELNKIKKLSEEIKRKDPFFFRRLLPNFLYKIYKLSKHNLGKFLLKIYN